MWKREDGDEIFLTQTKNSTVVEKEDDDFEYRFGEPFSCDELQRNIEKSIPIGTQYKSTWAFSVFKRWQEERGQRPVAENLTLPAECLPRNITQMAPHTLNRALNTILYLTGIHFAVRGGKEHRNLRLFKNTQITRPHTDHNGRTYLLYTEDTSRTNTGGLKHRKQVPKEVHAYKNSEDPRRCYVRLFTKYNSAGRSTDIFYFNPQKNPEEDNWFPNTPVGHNTLSNIVKKMCKSAGIEGKKKNHSLRVTAATRLYQADVEEQQVCKITGHRSTAVRTYKQSSDEQKYSLSSLLSMKRLKQSSDCTITEQADVGPHKNPSLCPLSPQNEDQATVVRNITLNFNFS